MNIREFNKIIKNDRFYIKPYMESKSGNFTYSLCLIGKEIYLLTFMQGMIDPIEVEKVLVSDSRTTTELFLLVNHQNYVSADELRCSSANKITKKSARQLVKELINLNTSKKERTYEFDNKGSIEIDASSDIGSEFNLDDGKPYHFWYTKNDVTYDIRLETGIFTDEEYRTFDFTDAGLIKKAICVGTSSQFYFVEDLMSKEEIKAAGIDLDELTKMILSIYEDLELEENAKYEFFDDIEDWLCWKCKADLEPKSYRIGGNCHCPVCLSNNLLNYPEPEYQF